MLTVSWSESLPIKDATAGHRWTTGASHNQERHSEGPLSALGDTGLGSALIGPKDHGGTTGVVQNQESPVNTGPEAMGDTGLETAAGGKSSTRSANPGLFVRSGALGFAQVGTSTGTPAPLTSPVGRSVIRMPASREELALTFSREAWTAQTYTEAKLREKATNVLQAASIVIPVAAIAVSKGPPGVAVPFGIAALAYALCAWQCASALYPRTFATGVHGSHLLKDAKRLEATVEDMQERAAEYLDEQHEGNKEVLEATGRNVQRAIIFLALETVGIAAALVVTLVA